MAILKYEVMKSAKITRCNGGYVVMCDLPTRKLRAKFDGASVAILSDRSGWIPYSNKFLDECTKKNRRTGQIPATVWVRPI